MSRARRAPALLAAALAGAVLSHAAPPDATAATLRAGAGRADITPPTGYYFLGWARSDSQAEGQHTRLFARALVIERGGRKLALVAADLAMVPAGMIEHAAELVRDRGISPQNLIVSASHTHGAQAGYMNFPAFNTVPPTRDTLFEVKVGPADPQLYAFMVRQLAKALRRADDNLAPASAGWGETTLVGLTANRSIEAHLADHGIVLPPGEGSASEDPGGYRHTIDPELHLLRVDKLRRGRRIPIGVFTTFANHGTVNRPTFLLYNADHHGSATRVVERALRRRGRVPRRQEVVNVFGNTDEGDVSSGLDRSGPAAADYVGRVEARATLRAWRLARRRMTRRPVLDSRWTRMCFCGQETAAGPVGTEAALGLPFLTGSEENRGPLYDVTQVSFEGTRNPVATEPHGHKIVVPLPPGSNPTAVALGVARIGDRLIATVPGEATAEAGRRMRAAVSQVAGPGIGRVVLSGLANDYAHYFTTPEEYDLQHYEGGATEYGRTSSLAVSEALVDLAGRLRDGQPAPDPYAYDSTNGVSANAEPFGPGAEDGQALEQPADVRRLGHAGFAWRGGPLGLDRPLDRAFVRVERRAGRRWRRYADDLGLQITWRIAEGGRYESVWEPPIHAPLGRYRIVVSANRYRLESASFRVRRSLGLEPRLIPAGAGRAAIELAYPQPGGLSDFTWRPGAASGGRVELRLEGRRIVLRSRGRRFGVAARSGDAIAIPAGAARDRHGNANGTAALLRVP